MKQNIHYMDLIYPNHSLFNFIIITYHLLISD